MATFCASGSFAASWNIQTLISPTSTVPPMIATRPSICMVVCISLRVSGSTGLPCASSLGTASTVIASATQSWITKPTGDSSAEAMNQTSFDAMATIASVCTISPYMISRLAAITEAPSQTSHAL